MMVCVDSCGFGVGFVERRTALTKTENRLTSTMLVVTTGDKAGCSVVCLSCWGGHIC